MASVDPPHRLGVIERGDMSIEEMDVFLPRPHALVVGPGGADVFTSSLAVNQIAVVDPVEQTLELTPIEGDKPHVFINFAVSPDGRWMVGTTEITSKLFIFDLDRVPDMTPVGSIDLPTAPWHPVYTPDGKWVYVGNNWDNSVSVIDMEKRELAKVITRQRTGPAPRQRASRRTAATSTSRAATCRCRRAIRRPGPSTIPVTISGTTPTSGRWS